MENLYLIKCNEYYKIGVANDLKSRLAALQTGNPYPLAVEACFLFPNAAIVEKALHQAFASVRKLGEWFELGQNEVGKFQTICNALGGLPLEDVESAFVNETDIGDAEEEQEIALDTPNVWDFAAMFADGWAMHATDGRKRKVTIYLTHLKEKDESNN